MKPLCSICQELFAEIDVLVSVKCGHIFHHHCLNKWLEGSKTCPHCRNKTVSKDVVRLYVDTASGGHSQQDATSLIQKVDSLSLQVSQKDQENVSLKDQKSKLEKQTEGLRRECKKLETKLKDKEMGIAAFKAQVDMYKNQETEFHRAREEIKEIRAKLALLKGVEKIICEEDEEITNILAAYSYSDLPEVRQLATFCAALKREVSAASGAKRKLRDDLKASRRELSFLQEELSRVTTELKDLKVKEEGLTADVERLEEEKASLAKKVANLQAALTSPSGDPRSSALNRFLHESPAPLPEEKREGVSKFITMPGMLPETPRPRGLKLQSRIPLADCDSNSESLSTSQSSQSIEEIDMDIDVEPVILKKFAASRLSANPRLKASPYINYNGFGGHGEADIFPKPRLGQTFKLKKSTSSSLVTKKVPSSISSSSMPKKVKYQIAGKKVQSSTLDKYL